MTYINTHDPSRTKVGLHSGPSCPGVSRGLGLGFQGPEGYEGLGLRAGRCRQFCECLSGGEFEFLDRTVGSGLIVSCSIEKP